MNKPQIGIAVYGEMGDEYVLYALGTELKRLKGTSELADRAISLSRFMEGSVEVPAFFDGAYYDADSQADDLIRDLVDALDDLAPEYAYFGKQGGEYGFWPVPVEDIDLPRYPAGTRSRRA